jgi:hypothetical protein
MNQNENDQRSPALECEIAGKSSSEDPIEETSNSEEEISKSESRKDFLFFDGLGVFPVCCHNKKDPEL